MKVTSAFVAKSLAIAGLIFLTALSAIAESGRRAIRAAGQERHDGRTNQDKNRKKPNAVQPNRNVSYVVGKNRFTTVVDGDTREYYVHVPRSYSRSTRVPLVLMLHGTSGDGERFYNISGWKELGETENILTVFPSSWRHCIIEQGVQKITTKWNVYPGTFDYCEGENPKDDIKFLSAVLDEMDREFNIDRKRVYVVGFSNGGQMAARVGVEMSDRIAAVVSASGPLHGSGPYAPKRLIPNLFQVGTDDPLFIATYFGGNPAPMDFGQLLEGAPLMRQMLSIYQQTFQLGQEYETGGDPTSVIWLEVGPASRRNGSVFRFHLIKGMTHVYPNGVNFPMFAARENWGWLKQFELPPNRKS